MKPVHYCQNPAERLQNRKLTDFTAIQEASFNPRSGQNPGVPAHSPTLWLTCPSVALTTDQRPHTLLSAGGWATFSSTWIPGPWSTLGTEPWALLGDRPLCSKEQLPDSILGLGTESRLMSRRLGRAEGLEMCEQQTLPKSCPHIP